MRIKRKLDMDRYETMLRDLETMHEKGEISEQTYNEMKPKYEEKMKELEESYFEEKEDLTLDLGELEELDVLGERISSRVEEAVSRAMKKVQLIVDNVPDFERGHYYTEEETHEGTFDSHRVSIDFSTVNGHIDVKKWDEDTYKVIVTKKVRGISKERAEEKLKKVEVNFEHIKDGKETLALKNDEHNVTVSILAYLPDKGKGGVLSLKGNTMVYDLDLTSVNGRISVAGITTGKSDVTTVNGRIGYEGVTSTEKMEAQTENGRILLEEVSGTTISVSTENGRIELMDAKGDNLEASTENGSVRGKLSFSNAELETENGSIRVTPRGSGTYTVRTQNGSLKIDVDRSVPYKVEAKTSMGSVRVADDLEVLHKEKRRATVQSKDFETGETPLSIDAKTDMGSIRIL
jgi:DUF4097 and DUF4098 domain-containing protein YvlB